MKTIALRFYCTPMLTLSCALVAPLLSTGCSPASQPTSELDLSMPDQQTLIEDSKRMAVIFDKRAAAGSKPFVHIDLSDDAQYAFVVHRLLASGKDPETSPHLFELVKELRAGGRPAQPAQASTNSEGVATAQSAINNEDWCFHFLTLAEDMASNKSIIYPGALSSCKEGSDFSYLDDIVYRTQHPTPATYTFVQSKSDEQYGNGRNFHLKLYDPQAQTGIDWNDNPGQNDENDVIVMDSLSVSARNGQQQLTYAKVSTVRASLPNATTKVMPVAAIKLNHPKDLLNSASPYWEDNFRIRTCLERGGLYQHDCDYSTVDSLGNPVWVTAKDIVGVAAGSVVNGVWTAGKTWTPSEPYNLTRRYLPLDGTYELYHPGAGCSIDSHIPELTYAILVKADSGGTCFGQKVGGIAGSASLAGGFSSPTTFDLLGDFGSDCFDYGSQNGDWVIKTADLYVTVGTKATGGCAARYATVKVAGLDFRSSCFAEGTEIRRADQTTDAVENFKIGDKVVADDRGTVLTVTGMSAGREGRPMVNLYDDEGHDLLITETHPVMTEDRGAVPARTLKEGDRVLTDHGVTTLISTARVYYSGKVYNLSLNSPEAGAASELSHRTMFAEGFVVGDNTMQQAMEGRPRAEQESGRGVPATWRKDYESYVARRGGGAR